MQDITDHPYSAHSRRPAQCRICKAPAGMHSASEASHMSLWKSLRYPLVTDRFQGYSARTLGVLTSIAALGGNVDSWDLNNRGWHKTAVAILVKDMIIVELDPTAHPRLYTLSEAGRQVCAWHGIEITAQDGPAAPDSVNDGHDAAMDTWASSVVATVAMADAVVSSEVAKVVKRGSAPADIRGCEVRGFYWPALVTAESRGLLVEHNGRFYPVPAPEVTDAFASLESEIWAGTGTVVRTRPRSFRKVKNTRSSRARRGGAR